MPKLLLFAPCDRVIVSQNQVMSLINIIQGMELGLGASATLGEGLVVPVPWTAAALWQRHSDEVDKVFEQKVEVVSPDSMRVEVGSLEFTFTQGIHRTLQNAQGFLISGEGEYNVVLSIREKADTKRWQRAASFPVIVSFKVPGTSTPPAL